MRIRPLDGTDREWVRGVLEDRWGSTGIVSRGRMHQADRLEGLIAVDGDAPCGLLTYRTEGIELEVVTLDALSPGAGVGTALLEEAISTARRRGLTRLWLVTTNDNVDALRFYQRRGLRLVAVHRDAVDKARLLKPSIPVTGRDDIVVRDELELELQLSKLGE